MHYESRAGTVIVTLSTHCILIVEDEQTIRTVLRVILAREGYELIEADTGARAETEIRRHKPDLLLMDLGLPDIDGLTVIRNGLKLVDASAMRPEHEGVAAPLPDPQPLMQDEKR